MGRLVRDGVVITQMPATIVIGDTDTQTAMVVQTPFRGAQIQKVVWSTGNSSGAGTGTFVAVVQEIDSGQILCAGNLDLDADAADYTEMGVDVGNGAGATAGGMALEVDTTKTGTVTTGATVHCTIYWK